MSTRYDRVDRFSGHRAQYERNKKKIMATQSICGICGRPVDKSLRYPHPMSATVDHIIPVDRGGHPSDRDNLQLAHFACNRAKSDKLVNIQFVEEPKAINNRDLPQSMDWTSYRSERG